MSVFSLFLLSSLHLLSIFFKLTKCPQTAGRFCDLKWIICWLSFLFACVFLFFISPPSSQLSWAATRRRRGGQTSEAALQSVGRTQCNRTTTTRDFCLRYEFFAETMTTTTTTAMPWDGGLKFENKTR